MWLRILKTLYVVAKATGLDSKIKDWVVKRVEKHVEVAVAKVNDKVLQADSLLEDVAPERTYDK